MSTPISISIGRLMDGHEPSRHALKFPSKVVSRQHALLWLIDKKDTKSSSGTFLNSLRLSPQGVESSQVELHDGDVIKLGEDCEVSGVVHQSIVFKVLFGDPSLQRYESGVEMEGNTNYVDYSFDPKVQAIVDVEFDAIWDSLTIGIDSPLKRLKSLKNGEQVIIVRNGTILRNTPHLTIDPNGLSSQGTHRASIMSNASARSRRSELTPIHTTSSLLNRSNSRGSPNISSPWRAPFSPISDSSGDSVSPSGRPLSRHQSDGTNHHQTSPKRQSLSHSTSNSRRSPDPNNHRRQQQSASLSAKPSGSTIPINITSTSPGSPSSSHYGNSTTKGIQRAGSHSASK